MANLELEIISRETIKPSSPAPHHQRTYQLSLLDQLNPRVYTPIILFYAPNEAFGKSKSDQLKTSLSKTLTKYYPFAGRITDGGLVVDCNDEGAAFIEAKMDCDLSGILNQQKHETLGSFFPNDILWNHKSMTNLLIIHVCFFNCRGIAISICVSHKIADASTISSFISDWATVARHPGSEALLSPQFISATVFPPNDRLKVSESRVQKKKGIKKTRLVFDASNIVALKSKCVAESGGALQNPTRVEVVTALICKCTRAASLSRANSHVPVLCQAVNLRNRLVPRLPKNTVGNIVTGVYIPMSNNHCGDLHVLVGKLRAELEKLYENYREASDASQMCIMDFELLKQYSNMGDKEMYIFTSWCRLGWYEVDFGWGNPKWVVIPLLEAKNFIALLDTRGGDGIEAWIALEEQEMDVFEHDEELLRFASVNPPVV